MKLKVKLSISDKSFYEVMMFSVTEDIFRSTGKKIKPYVGLEYTRSLPRMLSNTEIKTTYRIVELEENKKYILNVITPLETTVVEYVITKLEENKILVEYYEGVESTKLRVRWSNKFLRLVMSFLFAKRRMKKKLKQIQAYVKQQQLDEKVNE